VAGGVGSGGFSGGLRRQPVALPTRSASAISQANLIIKISPFLSLGAFVADEFIRLNEFNLKVVGKANVIWA
jgi:hypothetical protein